MRCDSAARSQRDGVCKLPGAPSDNAALVVNGVLTVYSATQNIFVGFGPEAAQLGFAANTLSLTVTPAPLPSLQFYSSGGSAPPSQSYTLPPNAPTLTVTPTTTLGGSWLSASVDSVSTLTVSVQPGTLVPAIYTGSAVLTTGGGVQVPVPVAFTVAPASLQYIQQGPKITGGALLGGSVSLSQDGNALLSGAIGDSSTGAVWVYSRLGGVWYTANRYSHSVAQSNEGNAAAISADGSVLLWGASDVNGSNGSAWVRGGPCAPAQLQADTSALDHTLGASVALSADGLTVSVGAYGALNFSGAAIRFICSQGAWQQSGGSISGVEQQELGTSVALSGDGSTNLIGVPDASFAGEVLAVGPSGQTQYLQVAGSQSLGNQVAISADGRTALLSDFTRSWVFTESGGTWSNSAELPVTFTALSADGASVVGLHQTAVPVIYQGSASTWTQVGGNAAPLDTNIALLQVTALSLSRDGSNLIVGSAFEGERGADWAFVLSGTPPPVLNNVGGTTTAYAGTAYQLTASGYNFAKGAAVQVNGVPAPTTFVSSTQLTANVPGIDITAIGNIPVTVVNPDGAASGPQYLNIAQPTIVVRSSHIGNFAAGRKGVYAVTVSNPTAALATNGTVSLIEQVPKAMGIVAMSGPGWNCSSINANCTRIDPLPPGASFPPIAVTVSVPAGTASTLTNVVLAQGNPFALGSAVDSTTIVSGVSACDINADQTTNVTDVQLLINEALGTAAAIDDLNNDGTVNVIDLNIVINAVLAQGTAAGCVV